MSVSLPVRRSVAGSSPQSGQSHACPRRSAGPRRRQGNRRRARRRAGRPLAARQTVVAVAAVEGLVPAATREAVITAKTEQYVVAALPRSELPRPFPVPFKRVSPHEVEGFEANAEGEAQRGDDGVVATARRGGLLDEIARVVDVRRCPSRRRRKGSRRRRRRRACRCRPPADRVRPGIAIEDVRPFVARQRVVACSTVKVSLPPKLPAEKSSIVSFPAPPCTVSLPAPEKITSSPPPASTLSEPPPASIVSAPLPGRLPVGSATTLDETELVVMVSLAPVPVNVAIVCAPRKPAPGTHE